MEVSNIKKDAEEKMQWRLSFSRRPYPGFVQEG
jgi:hypothetical protein